MLSCHSNFQLTGFIYNKKKFEFHSKQKLQSKLVCVCVCIGLFFLCASNSIHFSNQSDALIICLVVLFFRP